MIEGKILQLANLRIVGKYLLYFILVKVLLGVLKKLLDAGRIATELVDEINLKNAKPHYINDLKTTEHLKQLMLSFWLIFCCILWGQLYGQYLRLTGFEKMTLKVVVSSILENASVQGIIINKDLLLSNTFVTSKIEYILSKCSKDKLITDNIPNYIYLIIAKNLLNLLVIGAYKLFSLHNMGKEIAFPLFSKRIFLDKEFVCFGLLVFLFDACPIIGHIYKEDQKLPVQQIEGALLLRGARPVEVVQNLITAQLPARQMKGKKPLLWRSMQCQWDGIKAHISAQQIEEALSRDVISWDAMPMEEGAQDVIEVQGAMPVEGVQNVMIAQLSTFEVVEKVRMHADKTDNWRNNWKYAMLETQLLADTTKMMAKLVLISALEMLDMLKMLKISENVRVTADEVDNWKDVIANAESLVSMTENMSDSVPTSLSSASESLKQINNNVLQSLLGIEHSSQLVPQIQGEGFLLCNVISKDRGVVRKSAFKMLKTLEKTVMAADKTDNWRNNWEYAMLEAELLAGMTKTMAELVWISAIEMLEMIEIAADADNPNNWKDAIENARSLASVTENSISVSVSNSLLNASNTLTQMDSGVSKTLVGM